MANTSTEIRVDAAILRTRGKKRHGWFRNVRCDTYWVTTNVVTRQPRKFPWRCVYCHTYADQEALPSLWGCTGVGNPNKY